METKAAILLWKLSHKVEASGQPCYLIPNRSQLFRHWKKWKNPLPETILSDGWRTPSAISALKSWTHPHPCLYTSICLDTWLIMDTLTTVIQSFLNTVVKLPWDIWPDRWHRPFKYGGNRGKYRQIAVEGGAVSFPVLGQTPAMSHHWLQKAAFASMGNAGITRTRGLGENGRFGWTVDLDSTKTQVCLTWYFLFILFLLSVSERIVKTNYIVQQTLGCLGQRSGF